MRNYQLTVVLTTTLNDADRKKVTNDIKDLVKGAKITKEEEWGEKTLAYKIKRQDKGFYLNYLLETEENLNQDLDKKLTANENVLRHLLIRTK